MSAAVTTESGDRDFAACHVCLENFRFDKIFTLRVGTSCFLNRFRPMLFKKDPRKKLSKVYQQKMEAAMHALRKGDVQRNAFLTREAEAIKAQLDQLGKTK
jgi:hypothetical protein